MHVFPNDIPHSVFSGRLRCAGNWNSVEIDSAQALQCVLDQGTAYGVGCRLRMGGGSPEREFWAMVDAARLPRGGPSDLEAVKLWLPKCALVLAIAVLAKNQPIPEHGLFPVGAPDYSKDPQRNDARAFRQRCRFDVLNVFATLLNNNPPAIFCKHADLAAANTHTRIYTREDLFDAIQFWERRDFVSLLNRAGDVQIRQTMDDDMMAELSRYSWDEQSPLPAPRPLPDRPAAATAGEYDVFICHASEDKPAVVVPLTNELVRRGLKVWVDYVELQLGDQLRRRIDDGLSRSQFGVVVISPSFFAKPWPQTELDGLVALEMADGKKRILPIWHELEYAAVAQRSPTLATRLAAKWADGLAKVADQIVRAVRG